ncbi:MCE family protein [Kutzneria kofuensis]|uniref:Phospholipid/cholesterol/gamma-HCH transport system substrate-binding protein n=1 Tax=Kutzneria kofuensis TaxID=103725 RepID=A0A7W9KJS1_9PSEU|nr:MCE family protein [Kutzneria kofuensis]MBB5893725.1 phospholipid/cholesterol/gamma-HCH transport system substrate-binding protein [Kutzneria kofuensis]
MRILLALALVLGLTACGSDTFTVQAEFANVANLVPNAEVKIDDVTVGRVSDVRLDGWHARLTLELDDGVRLPANATAKIGQKSLLGAEYVELNRPAEPQGQLRGGDLIPLARTDRYPETEELLAGLSLWLNGGGLQNLRTIYTEVDQALGGREQVTRDLVDKLRTFTTSLDQQKAAIVATVDALDRLSKPLAAQRDQLANAIDHVTPGVTLLNQQRTNLTDALTALTSFSTVATRVIDHTQDDLQADLDDLKPILANLVAAGDALPKSLDVAGTLLFPLSTFKNSFRGDFVNVYATIDLSLQAADPLLAPLGGR